jgi:hypothetical protein
VEVGGRERGLALMYIPMYSVSKDWAKCCDDLQNIKFAICCKNFVPSVRCCAMAREVYKYARALYENSLVILDLCSCNRNNCLTGKK